MNKIIIAVVGLVFLVAAAIGGFFIFTEVLSGPKELKSEDDQAELVQNVVADFSAQETSYRMEVVGESAEDSYSIEYDAEAELLYTKLGDGADAYEFYYSGDGTSYTNYGGTWYKMEGEEGEDANIFGSFAEDLETEFDDFNEDFDYKGLVDCPEEYESGGECHLFEYVGEEENNAGNIYIDAENDRFAAFEYPVEGETQLMVINYEDINLELPEEAKNAKDFSSLYEGLGGLPTDLGEDEGSLDDLNLEDLGLEDLNLEDLGIEQ